MSEKQTTINTSPIIELKLDGEYYMPCEQGILHVIPNVEVVDSDGNHLGVVTVKEYL